MANCAMPLVTPREAAFGAASLTRIMLTLEGASIEGAHAEECEGIHTRMRGRRTARCTI